MVVGDGGVFKMIKFRTGRSNESGTGSCDVGIVVVVVVVTVGAGVCDVNDVVNGAVIDGMTIPWLA